MNLPKSSYIGRHAELYDLFYADKPYADEAAFVNKCIQNYKPGADRVLELACGTGTHSLLLEKYGYKIIATDYSPDMLARAQEKAKNTGSRVDFRLQDMLTLDVPERPFDIVICLFDSVGYVVTNENLSRVLHNVNQHLAPDGIFIFEFWHAGAMIPGYDPVRIRRWKVPDGEILRISETQLDLQAQLCNVTYSVYELENSGQYRFLQETQTNRFFLIKEMELLLNAAGMNPTKWYSGFHEDQQINRETWHILAIASRSGEGKL